MDPVDAYLAALDGGPTEGLFAPSFKAKINGEVVAGSAAIAAVLAAPGRGPVSPMGRLDRGGDISVTWQRDGKIGAARIEIDGGRIAAIAVRW